MPGKVRVLLLALAVTGAVGFLDRVAADVPSCLLLYLPAVALVSWRLGAPAALFIVLASCCTHLWAELGGSSANRSADSIVWETLLTLMTLVGLVVVLSRLRQSLDRARLAAQTDFLTGLANRAAFERRVEAELNRCRRTGRPLTVAYLDCDGFKSINDAQGHAAGDDILRTLARTLEANIRSYDAVARLGGDEFGVLLAEAPPADVKRVFSRIHDRLHTALREHGWPVAVSIGVATCIGNGLTAPELIRAADELMYQSKRRQKGDVTFNVLPG